MRQGVIQQSLDKLQSLLREQRVGVVELSGRPKNLFSIFKKMQTKVSLHFQSLWHGTQMQALLTNRTHTPPGAARRPDRRNAAAHVSPEANSA